MTDEEYYRCYLEGDESGLDALVKQYEVPLILYINGYLHDVQEAEDIMIEVFTYLFTKKPHIRDGCLKAYLYKTTRNMVFRHRKKQHLSFGFDELTEDPESAVLVEEIVQTADQNRVLHFCMEQLNPDYREALYLTYFEGLSYKETAKIMRKSVKQITNMVYRGKQSLRGILEKEGFSYAKS